MKCVYGWLYTVIQLQLISGMLELHARALLRCHPLLNAGPYPGPLSLRAVLCFLCGPQRSVQQQPVGSLPLAQNASSSAHMRSEGLLYLVRVSVCLLVCLSVRLHSFSNYRLIASNPTDSSVFLRKFHNAYGVRKPSLRIRKNARDRAICDSTLGCSSARALNTS